MGQPVTVLEKPSARQGIVRFEINRVLTGTGHEHYRRGDEVFGDRPPDELARRLLALGEVDALHVNSNVITVELASGGSSEGITEVIADLYTHYRPGVPVPSPDDFATEETDGEAAS